MDNNGRNEGRLVLTRKKGEKVIIGSGENRITITVMETDKPIKLAFESPKNVPVNRAEIAQKKNLI